MRYIIILFLLFVRWHPLSAQTPQWLNQGGGNPTTVYSTTVDKWGNTYATGYYQGSATFGSTTLSNNGLTDMFVVKYSPKGNLIWAKGFGGKDYDEGHGIVSDDKGNIYISGYFGDKATFGSFTLTSIGTKYLNDDEDVLILKMDSAGTVKWATSGGNTENDYGKDITIDKKGNLYVTGLFDFDFTFQGDTLKDQGYYDMFLIKIDTSGKKVWTRSAGSSGYDAGYSVTVDDSGYAYVYGGFTDTIKVGKKSYMTVGSALTNGIVVKYDTKGNVLWAKVINCSGENKIRASGKSRIYICGNFQDSIGFGSSHISAVGTYDGYIGMMDNNGHEQWLKTMSGIRKASKLFSDWVSVQDMAFDKKGNIYSTGGFTDGAVFEKDTLLTAGTKGNKDIFLVRYDSSGQMSWLNQVGGAGNDVGSAIAMDTAESIYTAGFFADSIRFGAYKVTGSNPAYFVKFSPCNGINAGISVTGKQYLCKGDSAILKVPYVKGLHYQWKASGAAIKNDTLYALTVKAAGNYSVDVSDNNCVKSSSVVTISTYSKPQLTTLSKTNFCGGDSVNLIAKADTGIKYQWYINNVSITGATSAVLKVKSSGRYNFRSTLSTGCSDTASPVTLNFYPTLNTPKVAYSGSLVICNGDSRTLNVTNKKGGDSLQWYFNSSPVSKANDTTYSATKTGVYAAYFLNKYGCYKSSNVVSLTVNNAPNAKVSPDASLCAGDSVKLGADSVAGSSYTWSSVPSGFSSTLPNPKVSPSSTTKYTLTEKIRASGCSTTHSVNVTINPIPVATISGGTTICSGDKASFAIKVSNVAAGQSWILTYRKQGATADNAISGTGPGNFTLAAAGLSATTRFTLTGISESSGTTQCSNNNLASADSMIVAPLLTATISGGTTICPGNDARLQIKVSNVQPGQSWKLNYHKQGSGADSTMTGTGNGTFQLRSTKLSTSTIYTLISIAATSGTLQCVNNNLTGYDTIKVNAAPAANTGASKAICQGAGTSIGASAVAGNSYSWVSRPNGFTSTVANPAIKPATSTTYYLTETINATGCSKTDSVSITVNPLPNTNAGGNKAICAGNSVNLGAAPVSGSSYTWSSRPAGYSASTSSVSVNPGSTTTYYLKESISATGCARTDSAIITVNPVTPASWNINQSGSAYVFNALDSSMKDSAYHWSFGDGVKGTGHRISHIYPKNKSYTVSLRVNSAGGCSNEIDSTVNISISGISIAVQAINDISIYPNPFQYSSTLDYTLSHSSNIEIALYSMDGRQIAVLARQQQVAGHYQFSINAGQFGLQKGSYLLKMMLDDQYISKLIMKL